MLTVLRHTFTTRILVVWVAEVIAFNWLLSAFGSPRMAEAHALAGSVGVATSFTTFFTVFNNAIVQFALWSFGLYSRSAVYTSERVWRSTVRAIAFSTLVLFPVYGLFGCIDGAPFSIYLYQLVVVLGAFMILITAIRWSNRRLSRTTPFLGNVLVLGTGPATEETIREARKHHGETFRLVGVLTAEDPEVGQEVHGCRVLGSMGTIREAVAELDVSTILFALPAHDARVPTEYLVKCRLCGIRVIDIGSFYESIAKKVLLEYFSPVEFLYRRNLLISRFGRMAKRVAEGLLALAGLVVFAPIMAVTAVLVRLTSPGPILYRQERTGEDGRPFTLMKFRSMRADAESGSGAVWAKENDPRVTAIGKFIRKTRIDEMPQLFNILRGEMSVVGPRPERPEFVEQLAESYAHYRSRHLVSPGLTGWAQVAFRYGASMEDSEEKLRYDLYYIKHMSPLFDLLIVITTIRIVLFRGGAR